MCSNTEKLLKLHFNELQQMQIDQEHMDLLYSQGNVFKQ